MISYRTVKFPLIILLTLFVTVLIGLSDVRGQASNENDDATVAVKELPGNLSSPSRVSQTNQDQLNCRYGTSKGYYDDPWEWIDDFGAGHHIPFNWDKVPLPEGVEQLRLVDVQQDKANGQYLPTYTISPPLSMEEGGLGQYIQESPNALWIAGNESDVAYLDRTGVYPEVYAEAYHEIYHFIKAVDPNAQVAVTGLSMASPGRLQYLDIVWDTYLAKYGEPMPVDVWTTHLYVLSEIRPWDGRSSDGQIALGTDPALALKAPNGAPEVECPKDDVICRAEHDNVDLFKGQIKALRTWMKEHGQQNKPLLLTEFSQLYAFTKYDDPVNPTTCWLMDEFGQCFTQERVSTYLNRTLDFLETAKDPQLGYPADEYRLVQQWTWYSLYTLPRYSGGSSNLLILGFENHSVGSESGMTQVGRTFRNRAKNSARTVNLVAGSVPDIKVLTESESADIQQTIGFYNNGSTAVVSSFNVTIYKDAALTQPVAQIQVTPDSSGIVGCSWGHETNFPTLTWKDVPVGIHKYWAKIDSADQIKGETSESDNIVTFTVTIIGVVGKVYFPFNIAP